MGKRPNHFINRPWRAMLPALALIALACTASSDTATAGSASAPATLAVSQEAQPPVIDHLTPRRDAVGPTPRRYSWTAIKDAEYYAMAIWNDVDVLIYRRNDLEAPFVDWPPDVKLEQGTYFWSVAAFRGGRAIAESGRAAFVVMDKP
jgi:hypothetical protein